MEEQTTVEKLGSKVSLFLEKYHALQGENEMLRNELASAKEQISGKDNYINQLQEENGMKDLEIEEIVTKIESILG